MTTMAEFLAREREQDERTVQSELGKAIHRSFQAIFGEPLPDRMALLLLQLAAAEAVKPDGRLAASRCETELDRAARHVARARVLVARQQERVARLQADGRPTEDALRMLDTFIQTLETMEDHQRILRDDAEGKNRVPEWIFARLEVRAARTMHVAT